MTARSCTPLRGTAETEETPFVCYHRLSDYSVERSCSPPTPTVVQQQKHSRRRKQRQCQSFVDIADSSILEQQSNLLMTPKASRVEPAHLSGAVCTPHVMHEELQLRARLDAELDHVRTESFRRAAPVVTPLLDGLYVGGFPDEETLEILRREGINTIINCCAGEYETCEKVRNDFVVHSFRAEDHSDYLILFHCYNRFEDIVSKARQMGHCVFVHCVAGVNRSVALCVAYMMQYYHMDPISCVRLFRAQGRANILLNVAFRHQIVDFYVNMLSK